MARENTKLHSVEKFLVFLTPTLWIVYAAVLCGKMKDLTWCKNNYGAFVGISVAWFIIVFITQLVIASKSIYKFDKKPFKLTWLTLPLLVFLVCFLPVFCLALHSFHKDGLISNQFNYVLLQTVMPTIVLGIIIYPLPKRTNQAANTAAAYLSVLNAFDIMDVISDFEYIQTYDAGSVAWFYVSVAISVLLLAFPIGLDEEDEDDPYCGRLFKSVASFVFTDISFCVLRIIVIQEEGLSQAGLVFVFKNTISALINSYLILKACCCRNKNYS